MQHWKKRITGTKVWGWDLEEKCHCNVHLLYVCCLKKDAPDVVIGKHPKDMREHKKWYALRRSLFSGGVAAIVLSAAIISERGKFGKGKPPITGALEDRAGNCYADLLWPELLERLFGGKNLGLKVGRSELRAKRITYKVFFVRYTDEDPDVKV